MPDLFPSIQPQATAAEDAGLPLCREAAWDFARGCPLFRQGSPVIVEGLEAVKVWACKALLTARARYEIYSWNYGSELETLIGQDYSDNLRQAEASRYIREALQINPYITRVTVGNVSFSAGTLALSVNLKTVYGEETIHV